MGGQWQTGRTATVALKICRKWYRYETRHFSYHCWWLLDCKTSRYIVTAVNHVGRYSWLSLTRILYLCWSFFFFSFFWCLSSFHFRSYILYCVYQTILTMSFEHSPSCPISISSIIPTLVYLHCHLRHILFTFLPIIRPALPESHHWSPGSV